jgi:hypothetical protein
MMDNLQRSVPPEQGTLQDCVYCGVIYPEIKGDCPRCHGNGTGFREARMMDMESSSRMILDIMNKMDLSDFHTPEEANAKRERLISLLNDIKLYDFDLISALIVRIKDLDCELGIDITKH